MGLRDFLVGTEHGCANCFTTADLGTIDVEYCCSNKEINSVIENINVIVVLIS
jgi:hypothetical protein